VIIVEIRHIEKREFIQIMQDKSKDVQRVGAWFTVKIQAA
jgi:hypothetical protein